MCRASPTWTMGTPRLLKPADQMRNVQRTASCGGEAREDSRESGSCRSCEAQCGALAIALGAAIAFSPSPAALFVNGNGALFLVEVAQHDLFAQQPGLHAFPTGESGTMQVRAET